MKDKIVTVVLPMADRTQTQFDTNPELKRQVKLLMVHEGVTSQAQLFLEALDMKWGNKYPDLRAAIKSQLAPKYTGNDALNKLLGRD
jgi:hypothetical protein